MTKHTKKTILQMADIASLAGVSKSTVSRALADSPRVNQKTKDLIIKIAKENNYRLNTAARNFRLKESLTIAVLLPAAKGADWRLSDPFFLELLGSIAEAVDDRGHQLLLSRTSPQEGQWIEQFINKHMTDGLILIGQGSQHNTINRLAESYRAISVWGTPINDDQNYPVVGSDNRLGGMRATEYLVKKGRKNIVFLGYRNLPEIEARFSGYAQALTEHNIDINKELILNERLDESNMYSAVNDLITSNTPFDAIVAVSDVYAMSAIRALQKHKLTVPEDVSVVGYDDISLASAYNPPLTTIHQNRSVGGKILVDNLLEAFEGHKPEAISLNPELIIRESA